MGSGQLRCTFFQVSILPALVLHVAFRPNELPQSDTKEVSKVLEDITNSSEKRKIVTMGMDSSSTSKKKKITEQSELITLEDALSYIPPHVTYSPHGTISKNTTQVGGKPPKKVLLWKDFFNMVNEHYFDNKQPRFKEPQFIGKFKVTNEEIVRQAINVNIFMVLNELTPNYEYSMRKVLGDGNPDYACYYLENTLILVIEIKRAHVLSELNSGQSLPDFYETNSRAKDVKRPPTPLHHGNSYIRIDITNILVQSDQRSFDQRPKNLWSTTDLTDYYLKMKMSNTEVSEEAKLRISDSSSSVTEADVSIPPITIPQVNTSNKSRSPISILPNDPKEMRKKAYYQNGIGAQ
ncbi:17224_t:CDS:2 [Entrophospora sp. SA101]|nr:17224_t:CDS:2 [Entrophospora sp. SA101]